MPFWTRPDRREMEKLLVWLILITVIIFPLASKGILCYAPVTIEEGSETAVTTRKMPMNTTADAQSVCAASSCAAMNCMIIILDASLLLASLILPVVTGRWMTVHRSPDCRPCCKG